MIRPFWNRSLVVWAARDLLRQSLLSLLLFTSLVALVTSVALLLLLGGTLSTACTRYMAQAPAVVVRRVDAGGWAPLPVAEALARAGSVAGVLRPRPRVWGVVQGPQGPLTVIGVGSAAASDWPAGVPLPQPGEALVGTAVTPNERLGRIDLAGRRKRTVTIVGRLPAEASAALHDGAVLHEADARALLGLTGDQATDLVLETFHDDEAQALIPDLARALGWPVRITTRREQLGRQLDDIGRRTGLTLVGFVPALLALALVVAAVGIGGYRRRWEMGLLKALGWSGGDIMRLHIYRGLLVAGPAVAVGVAGAYLLLFAPGVTWVARWIFGWSGPPPGLYLSCQGAAGGLLLAAVLVGLPFLAAVFWTGWQAAIRPPAECIAEER
jgi:hypothetical protein